MLEINSKHTTIKNLQTSLSQFFTFITENFFHPIIVNLSIKKFLCNYEILLPKVYLTIQNVIQLGQSKKYNNIEQFNKVLQLYFSPLLNIPTFRVLFLEKQQQSLTLAFLFLKQICTNVNKASVVITNQELLAKKEQYLFFVNINISSSYTCICRKEWKDLLCAFMQTLYEDLVKAISLPKAEAIFQQTYQDICDLYNHDDAIVSIINNSYWLPKCLLTYHIDNFYPNELTGWIEEQLRLTNEEAQKSFQQLYAVLNTIGEGIVVFTLDGNITLTNKEFQNMLEYTAQELKGKSIFKLLAAVCSTTTTGQLLNYQKAVQNNWIELKGRKKDGIEIPIEVKITQTQTIDGLLLTAAVRDITNRKQFEEALESARDELEERVAAKTVDYQVTNMSLEKEIEHRKLIQKKLENQTQRLKASNQALENFAYIASHDLKQPIRSITSFIQLLRADTQNKLSHVSVKYLQIIVDGAKKMNLLIDDLLAYAKLGTQQLQFQQLDFQDILLVVTNNLKRLIDKRKVIIEISENMPIIKGHFTQIQQLTQNLLENAIKFCTHKPKITIQVAEKERAWLFSVKDNGIGMDTKNLEKVFTIFTRLHTDEEYMGTGIGLSICKKVVEIHSGKIWAESTVGKGTTFFFTIAKDL